MILQINTTSISTSRKLQNIAENYKALLKCAMFKLKLKEKRPVAVLKDILTNR